MTDEINAPAEPSVEEARKKQLIAEGKSRTPPINMDMRWSVKRMEDKLGEAVAPAVSAQEAVMPAPNDELEALKAKLAEAEAKLAAQPSVGPVGMTTSKDITLPGDLARQESERKMLMDRCTQVGIAHLIPARANPDAIRDILGRHMAEKAQKQATEEAQARLKAKGPAERFVTMRVLPLGDKKISRGIHVPGFGDEMYERGDIIENVPLATAKAHEANGLGEIIGAI